MTSQGPTQEQINDFVVNRLNDFSGEFGALAGRLAAIETRLAALEADDDGNGDGDETAGSPPS